MPTHDQCNRSRQSTLSRPLQAVDPQNLLCLVRVICNPLENVVNDVAPRIHQTGSAIGFVHILWSQRSM